MGPAAGLGVSSVFNRRPELDQVLLSLKLCHCQVQVIVATRTVLFSETTLCSWQYELSQFSDLRGNQVEQT